MKNKRIFLLFIVSVFLVATFILVEQVRTTTYGEVLTNLNSKDEDIEEVQIIYYYWGEEAREMIVSDRDEIMKLIEQQPSDMKLKTTSHPDDAGYHMFF